MYRAKLLLSPWTWQLSLNQVKYKGFVGLEEGQYTRRAEMPTIKIKPLAKKTSDASIYLVYHRLNLLI